MTRTIFAVALALALAFALEGCSNRDATTPADAGAGPASDAAATDAGAQSGCGAALPALPVDELRHVTVGSVDRTYWLHVPASYAGMAAPLLLDFHGDTPMSYGDPALLERSFNRIVAKSDKEGFIVVNPIGLRDASGQATWNGGSGPPMMTDDVGFSSAILDAIEAAFCVDTKRVFVTGYSSGAYMAYRLACQSSDRIAAVAPVAGNTNVSCKPSRAVSVIDFAGTADPEVRYTDVTGLTIPGWVTRDGCGATSTQSFANGDSACDTWGGCKEGAEVTLCSVDGGGHTWPGGTIPDDAGVGHTTADLVAMDALWTFFMKHPMP